MKKQKSKMLKKLTSTILAISLIIGMAVIVPTQEVQAATYEIRSYLNVGVIIPSGTTLKESTSTKNSYFFPLNSSNTVDITSSITRNLKNGPYTTTKQYIVYKVETVGVNTTYYYCMETANITFKTTTGGSVTNSGTNYIAAALGDLVTRKVPDEYLSKSSTAQASSGYKFVNWTNSSGTIVSTDPTYKATSAGTYTANFAVAGYSVSYNTNDGTVTSGSAASLSAQTNLPSSFPEVKREGYIFGGWYTNNSFTTEAVAGTSISSNTTLYAKWTYLVNYYGNNETNGNMNNQEFVYGISKKLLPNAFVKTGFTFKGWSLSDTALSPTYTDEQNIINLSTDSNGHADLYAVWEKTPYTISYTYNDGTATNPTTYYYDTAAFTLNNPTKTGYTFLGWSGTGLSGNDNKTVTIENGDLQNRTYTAHWTPNNYTIAFNAMTGNTDDNTSKQVTFNSTYGDLAEVSKENSIFVGWFTNETAGNQVNSTDIVAITQDTTLYAHWLSSPSAVKSQAYAHIDGLVYFPDTLIDDVKGKIDTYINKAELDLGTENADIVSILTTLNTNISTVLTEADLVNEHSKKEYELANYAASKKDTLKSFNLTETELSNFETLIDQAVAAGNTAIESSVNTDASDNAYSSAINAIDTIIIAINAASDANDEAKADETVSMINEIGTVEYSEISHKKISDARESYDELSTAQKNYVAVDELKVLTDAEELYDKINTVVNAINSIGTVECTNACIKKIQSAKEIYDALSETEKTVVPSDVYDTLLSAINKLTELESKPGEIIKDIISDNSKGAPIFGFDNEASDLQDIVLNESDKLLVNKGQTATIYLEITDKPDKLNSKDIQLVKNILNNNQSAFFFDVTLWKQIGSESPEAVEETDGLITISIKIPSALINSDNKISRTYQIVRVHNGNSTIINGTYDEKTETLTFQTDKFSTYALLYTDEEIKDNTSTEPTIENTKEDGNENTSASPKTGDSHTSLPFFLLGISGIVIIVSKKRKDA